MRLLGRADSLNVRKVLWAMDELGVEVAREDYGGPFGKTDATDYRKMNPNGLVPTLVDRDKAIWESNSIIRYLAEVSAGGGFYGNSVSAAHVSQWMDWQLGTLNPHVQTLFVHIVRLGDKRDAKIVAENTSSATRLLNNVLSPSLSGEAFLFGSNVTAADVCLGVMLHRYVSLLGADALSERLKTYHAALAARKGFKAHVAIGKP